MASCVTSVSCTAHQTALLSDVDRDGQVELVVALTDRVVRVYRWCDDALRAISKCELMQQVSVSQH